MSVVEIDAKRRMVETPSGPMPDPRSIAELAKDASPIPRYLSASSYGASINALRDKGYSWKEVTEWHRGLGADFSQQALIAGWRSWVREQGRRK